MCRVLVNNKAYAIQKSLLSAPSRTREMRPEIVCVSAKRTLGNRAGTWHPKSQGEVRIWCSFGFPVLVLGGFDEVSAKKTRECFSFFVIG